MGRRENVVRLKRGWMTEMEWRVSPISLFSFSQLSSSYTQGILCVYRYMMKVQLRLQCEPEAPVCRQSIQRELLQPTQPSRFSLLQRKSEPSTFSNIFSIFIPLSELTLLCRFRTFTISPSGKIIYPFLLYTPRPCTLL